MAISKMPLFNYSTLTISSVELDRRWETRFYDVARGAANRAGDARVRFSKKVCRISGAIVNDAAMMTFQPIVNLADDDWDGVLDVNLRSVFLGERTKFVGSDTIRVGNVGRPDCPARTVAAQNLRCVGARRQQAEVLRGEIEQA